MPTRFKQKEGVVLFRKSKKTIVVKGMSCSHCERTVENGLHGINGVVKVKADFESDSVVVYYKNDEPDINELRQKIITLGYELGSE